MKVIRNNKTGHVYTLSRTSADTNGASLEMEASYPPQSKEPPAHYHPHQSEHFRVISGALTVRMKGQVRILHAGDTLDVPPNTIHSMWNHTANIATTEWITAPALNTEQFFETFAALAESGRTNDEGVPSLLQLSLILPQFHNEFRLASPPFWIMRLAFTLLAPLARLAGYKPNPISPSART